MPGANAELLGADDLISQLQKLADAAPQNVDDALEAAAQQILTPIVSSAPEKSGVLKNSISLRTTQSSGNRVVKVIEVSSQAFYWRYLEFGTRFIQAREFVRKTFRNRKSSANDAIAATLRDRMGFND
jgi:HK97 gp10 family phage protein